MSKKEMESKYNPKEFENRIYDLWMDKEAFKAEVNKEKEPYTIVLPPPNITGQLHMGHALDHTLQDVLIRFKRMQGYEALWLPGTDHASIATEVKVLEAMKAESGKTKDQMTRDEFLERAWGWRDEYGRRIVNQMKKLGNSCDWSKERFTMDEGCNDAVTDVFIRLYEKGLIYKGYRLVNWCPDCNTTLSDAEVEHEEKPGHFWHINYPVKGEDTVLEIATTRPETMLGDTAIAVNPNDDRYKHLIGKTAILPLVGREIPIVGDEYVDLELGTGALKVTPAHDPNDFEIGKRHDLEQLIILNFDATMNDKCGKYEGMPRYEARKAIVEDLKEQGFLVEVKDHDHNVGTCYRCHTVIEPMLSDQWFVAMETLAKPAQEAEWNKDVKFVPERFNKMYHNWLANIRDWCISRQLWWGHQIPAYYCECGEVMVAKEAPTLCPKCGGSAIKQDEDVLDTWFSSALWPFSTLGWPNETPELEYFYPTNVLVTGYDIITFWVLRMVFSGLEHTGEVPFEDVFIHGLVRDAEGRKMSKSLGNGVDPLEVIEKYGADALRFMLMTGNSPGNDLRYMEEKMESSRNFANKLWNASRFVIMGLETENVEMTGDEALTLADKWILSRYNTMVEEITVNIDKYELGIAAQKIYDFTWNEYCGWYIELAKARLYGEDAEAKETVQKVLVHVLDGILRLLHPFMPFITEEIFASLPKREGLLIHAPWPTMKEASIDKGAEADMTLIMDAIRNLRNVRAEMDVPPKRKASCLVLAQSEDIAANFEKNASYMVALASCKDVSLIKSDSEVPEGAVSTVVNGAELFLPLEDLIDFEKEIERLTKEQKKLEGEIKRVNGKLSNEGFVKKAPEKVIIEEREKQAKYQSMLDTVNERLASMRKKL